MDKYLVSNAIQKFHIQMKMCIKYKNFFEILKLYKLIEMSGSFKNSIYAGLMNTNWLFQIFWLLQSWLGLREKKLRIFWTNLNKLIVVDYIKAPVYLQLSDFLFFRWTPSSFLDRNTDGS